MKNIKRILAVLLVLATLASALALTAGAATVENGGRSVTGVRGGQTLYITTNNNWNANLPGGFFNTTVKITIPVIFRDLYQADSDGQTGKIRVTTFKKTGSGWEKQKKLSGSYFCNAYSGVLSKAIRLPGKGAQYKLVITPETLESVKTPSDLTGIMVNLSNHGVVTSVI